MNVSENLELMTRMMLEIKKATTLEDAKRQAESNLEKIATIAAQSGSAQRSLIDLFR